jgi:hypothetical protein
VLLEARGPRAQHAAEQCFDRAIAIATGQNARSLLLRAVIARVGLRHGDPQTADITRMLEPVYDSFGEGFNLPDLQLAARLIGRASP